VVANLYFSVSQSTGLQIWGTTPRRDSQYCDSLLYWASSQHLNLDGSCSVLSPRSSIWQIACNVNRMFLNVSQMSYNILERFLEYLLVPEPSSLPNSRSVARKENTMSPISAVSCAYGFNTSCADVFSINGNVAVSIRNHKA